MSSEIETHIEADEGCDDNLGSFPLSIWSQDWGFKAFGWASLQDSAGKKLLMGHKRRNKSRISTTAPHPFTAKSKLHKLGAHSTANKHNNQSQAKDLVHQPTFNKQ